MKTLVITIRCEVFAVSTETAVLRRTSVEVVWPYRSKTT